MNQEEILNKVIDLVKGVLGVKAQSSEIMLTNNGTIIFRVDKACLYVIDTEEFTLVHDSFFVYSDPNINSGFIIHDLMNAYQDCIKPMQLLVRYESVQDDAEFERLTRLKSRDGLEYYDMYDSNNKKYKIPMYTGFVKFNKNDKADIEIYDDGPYLINKFIIKKKKINYPIQVYFRTIKY